MTALEKATRAALTASHQHAGGTVDPDLLWSVVGKGSQELYAEIARAVLMAVRDIGPEIAGKLAGGDYTTFSYGGDTNSFDYVAGENVQQFAADLIDAILNEGQS